MKSSRVVTAVVVASALAHADSAQTGQAGVSCDRTCLLGIADAYLTALVAHDPSKAPLAPGATFTEQTKVLAVGEGLWRTVTEGPTLFKLPVPDPVAGQIGMIVMLKANMPIEAMGFVLPLYSKNGWSPFTR